MSSVSVGYHTDTLWHTANQHLSEKQYQKALSYYNEIYNRSAPSAGLLHNMGLSYLQLNQLSDAVLCFERALLLEPYNRAIKQSLAAAQSRVETKLDQPQGLALFQWLNRQLHAPDDVHYGLLSIFLSWWAFLCFYFFKRFSKRFEKLVAFIGGVVGLILLCVSFAMAVHRFKELHKTPYAVVTALGTPLKSSPDTNSDNLIKLSEGLKVAILDQVGDWRRVKLHNGEQGWVSAADLELVDIFK